jgi:hypothetical protein
MASGCTVDMSTTHVLIGVALQFSSLESKTEITIEPCETLDRYADYFDLDSDLHILIEVTSSRSDEADKKFNFKSRIKSRQAVPPRVLAELVLHRDALVEEVA